MVRRRKKVYMKFTDIIELAKQGYKPSDIKELIELSKEEPKEEPKEAQTPAKEQIEEQPEEKREEVKEKEPETPSDDSLDYKKKIEELEATISKLQKENTRKNIADSDDQRSSVDVFNDAMRNFM